MLWDSGNDDENCMFTFGTMQNLKLLEEYKLWFMDGTFKVAPELFFQVFTLHALINNRAMPLLYILMPSKTEEDYTCIFCAIVNLRPSLAQLQLSITADYKIASHNAATGIFPNATIAGCFFHLGQCLWRKIQEHGLGASYRDVEDIRQHAKMLLAVSFVLLENVANAFGEPSEVCPDALIPVLDYWKDNFIGRQRRNRQAQPRFATTVWNVRERVEDSLPKTNNSVEGWYHAFQSSVDCYHPTVYKLISHFLIEQENIELCVARFLAGELNEDASKAKYVQLSTRLNALMPTYENRPLLDFLRAVSQNSTL